MSIVKVDKRSTSDMTKRKIIEVRAISVILSLVFAGLIIAVLGYNPIKIFVSMIEGALGTEIRIKQTILKSVPLIITSLGILVAFKMKFWNIGGEGQIMMGAFAASAVALNLDLPQPLMLITMVLASMAMGGIWAFIPAFFKAKMGTNETIFTLMLNYLAIKFVTYLQYGPWKDPNAQGFPKIANFPETAVLPSINGIHIGFIIALLLVVAIHIFINYTKKGYEITVVGESISTAKYAGMNIPSIIIISMLLSGGLCGLTGMIQASGVEKTLTSSLSANYGFTAITTTWLAQLNAIATLFVCVAFSILVQGGNYIQISMQVPSSVADIIQAIILFFVLGSEFFIQYKVSIPKFKKESKGVQQ